MLTPLTLWIWMKFQGDTSSNGDDSPSGFLALFTGPCSTLGCLISSFVGYIMSYLKIWYLNVSLWLVGCWWLLLVANGCWWLLMAGHWKSPFLLFKSPNSEEALDMIRFPTDQTTSTGMVRARFGCLSERPGSNCHLLCTVESCGSQRFGPCDYPNYMRGNQLWVKCEIRRGERRHGPKISSRYKEYTWLGDQNGYTTRNVPKAKKLRKLYVGGWKDDKRHGLRLKFRMKTELPEGGSSWADPGTFSRHFAAQVAELVSSAMVSSSRATGLRLDMEVTNMAVSPQKMFWVDPDPSKFEDDLLYISLYIYIYIYHIISLYIYSVILGDGYIYCNCMQLLWIIL